MAKNRSRPKNAAAEGQGDADSASPKTGPALWLRIVLSLLVAWHVFVVFISPMAIAPSSILVQNVAYSDYLRWYSDTLYLNHGYDFFGPDPPRSQQLVSYRVTDASGEALAEGSFPNKEQQWPRLYYHRHMMLADQASNGPPDMPAEEWLRLTLRGYGRHLLRRHGGDRVTIDYKAHTLLAPEDVLKEADPNAPRLFHMIVSLDETGATLDQPLPVPPRQELQPIRRIPIEPAQQEEVLP